MQDRELDLKRKSKREDNELKLYRILGVESFRKLVFLLEKVIHRKDKGKNTNYHIKDNDSRNAKHFIKYLYYNGSIHVRNAAFLSFLIIIKVLLFKASFIFDILLLLNLTKDFYCIMLQRYNYIRINKIIRLQENRENRKINANSLMMEKALAEKKIDLSLTVEEKQEDLELIGKMKEYLLNFDDICLGEEVVENLQRIRDFLIIYKQVLNVNKLVSDDIVNNRKVEKEEDKILWVNLMG